MKKYTLRFIALLLSFVARLPAEDTAAVLTVDFDQSDGKIRALHGVNGGPLNYGDTVDLARQWKRVAIPNTRLHDCEWPSRDVVDFHSLFPSLSADPLLANSYNFAKTDAYLQSVRETGASIVFRLGESIEHSKIKHHVHPPADYDQWSAACLGIIRHYNEGWASGFHHDIRYWEIWNEPENQPACWTGSDEQYYRLYAIAARRIKERYPDLKVGGPSVGATGEIAQGAWKANPFLQRFVEHCRKEGAPLDFVSWHTYTDDPTLYGKKAQAIRAWLDEQGFHRAELHLNEWNFLPDNDWSPLSPENAGEVRERWYEKMGGPAGAAFIGYVLCDLQSSPIDVANLFTGDSGPFGLFTRHGAPKKTFYSLVAFRMLLDTPERVRIRGDRQGSWTACAGLSADRRTATILLAAYRPPPDAIAINLSHLPWKAAKCNVARLDADHNLEVEESIDVADEQTLRISVKGPSVVVLQISDTGGRK